MLDPINMQRLAHIRQQELLQAAEEARSARRNAPLVARVISAISALGQHMTGAGLETRQTNTAKPALDTRELRMVSVTDSGEFTRPVR